MSAQILPNPANAPRININNLTDPKIHLTVAGFYRGIPIQQDGQVIKFEQDELYVSVKDERMYACTGGQVYLFAGTQPEPIHAALETAVSSGRLLVLKQVEACWRAWQDRQEERVQPKNPLHVLLRCRRRSFRAVLDNLSVGGAGLLVERACEPLLSEAGTRVVLTFPPACGLALKSLLAQTAYCEPVTGSLVRVGLTLLPTHREAAALQAYFRQRKSEILEELEKACQEQTRPRDVVSLYF